jgi:hypothetical protein
LPDVSGSSLSRVENSTADNVLRDAPFVGVPLSSSVRQGGGGSPDRTVGPF